MPEKNPLRFTEIRQIETAVLAIEKESALKIHCSDNQFGWKKSQGRTQTRNFLSVLSVVPSALPNFGS